MNHVGIHSPNFKGSKVKERLWLRVASVNMRIWKVTMQVKSKAVKHWSGTLVSVLTECRGTRGNSVITVSAKCIKTHQISDISRSTIIRIHTQTLWDTRWGFISALHVRRLHLTHIFQHLCIYSNSLWLLYEEHKCVNVQILWLNLFTGIWLCILETIKEEMLLPTDPTEDDKSKFLVQYLLLSTNDEFLKTSCNTCYTCIILLFWLLYIHYSLNNLKP